MKYFLCCLALIIGGSALSQAQSSAELAPTPPMGWNSYNCFGATVEEAEVRANAEYVAKYLKPFGWDYVVIDFCWWYPHPPGSSQSNPPQFSLKVDGSLVPYFQMDNYGRLLPDPRRFPSSTGSKGFKPLADYIHSLGLKFGIHVMRGIPRQAVWYNTPILGTDGIKAKNVVDTTSICPWLNNMWGVKTNVPGGQEYYDSILKLYAEWGVDYIKLDDTDLDEKYPYRRTEVAAFHQAIANSGRPITLSLSLNMKYENREHAMENAELWRISKDFWDSWEQLEEQFPLIAQWAEHAGPGNWPDADMLQLGKIAKRGPVGKERYSRFTEDEQYTHMSLWCIARSPLMMGGNLPENTPFTLQLLTNPEVLAVHQKGEAPRQLYWKDDICVWVSKIPGSNDLNLGVFNTGESNKTTQVSLAELGLPVQDKKRKALVYQVRDLWKRQDLSKVSNLLEMSINPHGAKLFRISLLPASKK